MEEKYRSRIINLFLFPNKSTQALTASLILLLIPLIYFLVYKTGGIKFVFSHSMYFPLILASIFWGIRGGIPVAIAGGLLLGPLMPIDIITGEKQMLVNWIYRLCFFVTISSIVGFFSDALRHHIIKLKFISTHNNRTGLLNMFSITADEKIAEKITNAKKNINIFSILWNNYNEIAIMFGMNLCFEIIKALDKRFQDYFSGNYLLLQAEISSLYVIIESDDSEFYLHQVQHVLNIPFLIENVPFYAEFSVGLAPHDLLETEDLDSFQKANIASLYSQKMGISSSIFENKKILVNKSNLLLLGEFPYALRNGQIVLHYQPKFDLNTKKPVGMEALIRWAHPERGMICPMEFIPLVEESNLIHILTKYVVNQSLIKMKELNDFNMNYSISINISPKNLINPRFLEEMINIFDKHNIASHFIEFEITESALMSNSERVNMILNSLKNFKIALSIDDFGTGYSSLAYLSRYPIDIIKIDQFFVKHLFKINGINHIIKAAIDLSHNLGLKVVAEGIEDERTESELLKMGCDFGQGYYYSKPIPDSEVLDWFRQRI